MRRIWRKGWAARQPHLLLRQRWLEGCADQPRLQVLVDQLLELGGWFCVFREPPEPHLDQLLARGRVFTPARLLRRPGRSSGCHGNAAAEWLKCDDLRIVTGYALSDDGLWRQHSWGLLTDDRVVETTVARLRYFGAILTDPAAAEFVLANFVVPREGEDMGPLPATEHLQYLRRWLKRKSVRQRAAAATGRRP